MTINSSPEVNSHEARQIILDFVKKVNSIYTDRNTQLVMEDPVTLLLLNTICIIAHFAESGDAQHVHNVTQLIVNYVYDIDENGERNV